MGQTDHHHTPAEERKIREAALDETVAGSFPASDPPSSIPNPDDHDAVPEASTERRTKQKVVDKVNNDQN